MKFRCKIGIHKWVYSESDSTRRCECGKVEYAIKCVCYGCGDEFVKFMTKEKFLKESGFDIDSSEGKEYIFIASCGDKR